MDVTFLGHAGLFIQTRYGSILCDPWFNPAYFASWLPFPSNANIDPGVIGRPDYLYLSHLHRDHFDADFLRGHVSKDTTVLLPDYPLDLMERELRRLGFTRFVRARNGEPTSLAGGLRITIVAMVSPADGPLGDSGLIVDDGQVRIYDQNDSRPVDLDRLRALGPYDGHFVQFSGAIWFPFVYQYPPAMLQALGRKKRANEMARALRYAREVDARFLFPSAGPPCFLDDGLFELNDFDRDHANTFPDQAAFLDYLGEQGFDRGLLLVPGSVVEISPGGCRVEHPLQPGALTAPFADKRSYLLDYKTRVQPTLDRLKASWPRGVVDILPALKDWFEPILDKADVTCAAIGGPVALDLGEGGVAIDFNRRVVEPWRGDDCDYYFKLDPALVEYCIVHHLEDWVNAIFLSFRFEARRKGVYNEFVYNFFKCLSVERLQYAEGYYAENSSDQQFWETHGYRIQRRCPHLKADLTRFAQIENGILTCMLHGWQFELSTGRCLTSDDRRLYAVPVEAGPGATPAAPAPSPGAVGATVRPQCGHCWYEPRARRAQTASRSQLEGPSHPAD
jgi:UDP-MurNAc hydroxylase